ncbi:MAG TPA: DUF3617 family protein [Caulobacteraceae bacterium]|nr:DUF3617 family protein [Caulobacteraceae bacterium]
MKRPVLLVLAAVSLGGCDMIPGFGTPASPQRKPGLWEQTVTTERSPTPIVTQLCFDAASDRRLPVLPRKPRREGACQKWQVSKNGDTYVIDSDCGFGGVKLTNHAELTGDFTSHYTLASTITVQGSPDPARDGTHKTTMTAVYKGESCDPAGLQPGQVKLPSGDVVDMAQLRGRLGGGGGRGGGNATGGETNAAGGGNATAGGGR